MLYLLKLASVVSLLTVFFTCTGLPPLEKGGHVRDIHLVPNATLIYSENYKVLGRSEGESSTFFFLGFLPVTNPLNIEYAMSTAVQKIEGGQSMVNVKVWHETHYYFPLGRISVVKIEGDVVSFVSEVPLFDDKKSKPPDKKSSSSTDDPSNQKNKPASDDGGLNVSGKKNKPASDDGGLNVSGKKNKPTSDDGGLNVNGKK